MLDFLTEDSLVCRRALGNTVNVNQGSTTRPTPRWKTSTEISRSAFVELHHLLRTDDLSVTRKPERPIQNKEPQ